VRPFMCTLTCRQQSGMEEELHIHS
jgi:hypothetical protein